MGYWLDVFPMLFKLPCMVAYAAVDARALPGFFFVFLFFGQRVSVPKERFVGLLVVCR